jgi:hypothetical protein
MWAVSSQKKAAVSSYKTTMNSVATAVEMCSGTGTGQAQSGSSGDLICNPTNGTTYPKITSKCGSELRFCVTGSGSNWNLTTGNSSCLAFVGCKGCRINCTVSGCTKIEEVSGSGACF